MRVPFVASLFLLLTSSASGRVSSFLRVHDDAACPASTQSRFVSIFAAAAKACSVTAPAPKLGEGAIVSGIYASWTKGQTCPLACKNALEIPQHFIATDFPCLSAIRDGGYTSTVPAALRDFISVSPSLVSDWCSITSYGSDASTFAESAGVDHATTAPISALVPLAVTVAGVHSAQRADEQVRRNIRGAIRGLEDAITSARSGGGLKEDSALLKGALAYDAQERSLYVKDSSKDDVTLQFKSSAIEGKFMANENARHKKTGA